MCLAVRLGPCLVNQRDLESFIPFDAPAVVEQHWRELTPMDAARLLDATPDRARNIALSGSSKVGKHGHDRMYLLLKSAGGESNWRQRHEHALNLYDITRQLGAVAMMISDQPMLDSGWTTDKALWLVENQVLFDNLEWFQGATGDTLVWYRGALPNMLINWFALTTHAVQTSISSRIMTPSA